MPVQSRVVEYLKWDSTYEFDQIHWSSNFVKAWVPLFKQNLIYLICKTGLGGSYSPWSWRGHTCSYVSPSSFLLCFENQSSNPTLSFDKYEHSFPRRVKRLVQDCINKRCQGWFPDQSCALLHTFLLQTLCFLLGTWQRDQVGNTRENTREY